MEEANAPSKRSHASDLRPTIATDDMPPVLARPDIGWYDMDLERFVMWNCSIFFCIRCIVYPSMLIKTRLQAQHKRDRYSGVWSAFTGILKREGPRGLYQGFVPFQCGSIFSQFLYISSFEYLRAQIPQSTLLGNLVAGGLASVFSSVLQVPLEVVSQRQIVQDRAKSYVGTFDTMRHIARTEGVIRGFYRGWTVSLILYAPYSSLWWVVYGVAKDNLQPLFPLQKQQHMVHAVCGVTAASVSAVLTNCIDVVKTRLQVSTSEEGQRPTIRSVMRKLWEEEGIRALGKGGLARVMHVAPSSLLVILGYEEAKRLSCKSC